VRETGSYDTPVATWELIEALDDDAESETPSTLLPHDSAAPLPAGVIVRANTRSAKAGAKSGALIAIPVIHRAQTH
jgi:hypothetical protein